MVGLDIHLHFSLQDINVNSIILDLWHGIAGW
jgi:hypothetical protein